MADEPNQNSEPPQQTEGLGNQPEARNPDGSLKDNSTPPTGKKPDTEASDKKPEDKKPEGEKKPEEKKGAPEKYEPFTVPEGHELDTKLVESATSLFKELNLDQAGAQKMVDFWNQQTLGISERLQDMVTETRNSWRDEIAKDKTLGNGTDGFRDEVRATIGRAIDGIGDQKAITAFKEAMDLTGAGDHPGFVRGFYELAKQLAEGKPVKGSGPAAVDKKPPSPAQALFPNLPSAAG